jgi:hypothetical protein
MRHDGGGMARLFFRGIIDLARARRYVKRDGCKGDLDDHVR